MKKLVIVTAVAALIIAPAFAADMTAVPYAWSGFYGGIQFGGGWSNEAVNFSPNDVVAAGLLNGTLGFIGEQPLASGYRISQSGAVGGFEAGYNWQAGTDWLLGIETDFSLSGMNGRANGAPSIIAKIPGPGTIILTQSTTTEQSTDWYGTVRGRAGWLATPNLLLFGTSGFAYGKTSASVAYTEFGGGVGINGPISFLCPSDTPCFVGAASGIRTGWIAGGGVEYLLDQRWSAKIEYQFVDLGTEIARLTAVSVTAPGESPSSFNVAIRDRFNVVRVGLNYRY